MGSKPEITNSKLIESTPDQDHKSLLQRLADTIDQVFWFTEIEPERVLYISPAYEQIWGRSVEELYEDARVWMQAIHPEDREFIATQFISWLEGTIPEYRVEFRIVRPDGTIRWISDTGAQIHDKHGKLNLISGIAKDITEEKLAKDAIQQSYLEIAQLKERLLQETIYLQEEIESTLRFEEIVGNSDPLRMTLSKVEQVAPTDASVLLIGETGTGKELLARSIHRHSQRKDRPLVKVNCASLPRSLIESELFGHVKGAFTGALSNRIGRFQLAHEGTIFLDEIGELDQDLQAKLLRVLQEGEFEQLGSSVTTHVDIRIVAATNRDLHAAVNAGTFRADLYYRLAVFPIEVPPLRVRRDDIPLLVWRFITQKKVRLGKQIEEVPRKVMDALIDYDWPGNVRELENVIERAMILSPGKVLILEDLVHTPTPQAAFQTSSASLEDVDRAHIISVLEECNWTIKVPGQAAERLELAPSTLRYRMNKLGIKRPAKIPR
ncbi:MAG: sigma 54-interacting transcriptional regulator [Planctomycetes bacterium]|nr:sigma 54-interacting transcriptional regulator [Planctomycetota bacterium]